VSITH